MLKTHVALALLGTSLAFTPALAQTQPMQTQPAAPSARPSSGAMNTGNWMTQEKPGQWRASKMEGLNVYNSNEKIGDISELLVDQNGRIEAVVIGVGGFLGMGEHHVAVPFDQIKFVNEPRASATVSTTPPTTGTPTAPSTTGSVAPSAADANRTTPDHAMLNMTKEELKAAPEFKYTR